ncbi:MAG: hypothetical protein P8012_11515 [Desulfobacterales bacterium]
MKKDTSTLKEKKTDRSSKKLPAKNRNRIDQPFDFDAVAAAVGPEYVRHMNRDGLACVPYEEVKKSIPGYYLPEDTCVWMRAGVINFRRCDYDYDCYNCPFDHAMRSAMGEKIALFREERQAYWLRHVKEKYQITARPCIHFLSGQIESPRECVGNYKCDHCTVHELMDKETEAKTFERSVYQNVSGYRMVEDYYYHFGHSWVHIEDDGRIKVGIDDLTSKVLGAADAINLPPVGPMMILFIKDGCTYWMLKISSRNCQDSILERNAFNGWKRRAKIFLDSLGAATSNWRPQVVNRWTTYSDIFPKFPGIGW